VILSKLTEGVLRTHNGLTANLVTSSVVDPHFSFLMLASSGSFFNLCTVSADTTRVPKPKVKNPRGSHYEVHYEVALLFGLTELKAQIVWMEDGVEKR